MDTNTLAFIIVAGLAVLFLGIGILLIFLYRRNQKKASESLTWPETTGTIINAKIRVEDSVFDNDEFQNGSQQMYSADISYTYQADGILYTSERISFAGKSSYSKRQKAEEIIARYPVNSTVSVFFNPQKHEEAVLDRSAKGSGVLMGAGIAFLSIGLIALVLGIILL